VSRHIVACQRVAYRARGTCGAHAWRRI